MKKKMIFIPIFFVAMAVLVGFVVMYLWNWLMPEIFGLDTINYWQALGMLILAKIFFGGCGSGRGKCHGACGHRHGGHRHWKDKFKNKWQNMSDEEKQKWEGKFGSKCKTWNEEATESPKEENDSL